jgi:putative transposase
MNPPNHRNRQSIRLKNYDYSQAGVYFITINTKNKNQLFGEIIDDGSDKKICSLNQYGRIAREEWLKTPEMRPNIKLGEFVIMPDHMHGIVIIDSRGQGGFAGEGTRHRAHTTVLDTTNQCAQTTEGAAVNQGAQTTEGAAANQGAQTTKGAASSQGAQTAEGSATGGGVLKNWEAETTEKFGKPTTNTIPTIIRGFKSAVTIQINRLRNTPGMPVWHKNYYEHVIRDEEAYRNISEYIHNNPNMG